MTKEFKLIGEKLIIESGPDVTCPCGRTVSISLDKDETAKLYRLLRKQVVRSYITAYLIDLHEYNPNLFNDETLLSNITEYLLDRDEQYVDIRHEDIEDAIEHFRTDMQKYYILTYAEDEDDETDTSSDDYHDGYSEEEGEI